jgi:hypothetical protein
MMTTTGAAKECTYRTLELRESEIDITYLIARDSPASSSFSGEFGVAERGGDVTEAFGSKILHR